MSNDFISTPWTALLGNTGGPDAMKAAVQRHSEDFWQAQIKAIDAMQAVATGWLSRRREGAEAARSAAAAMCACSDPVEAVRAYQNWATGSMERIAADVLALQSQAFALLPALAANMTSAAVARVAEAAAEAKPGRARPPASPRSEAA